MTWGKGRGPGQRCPGFGLLARRPSQVLTAAKTLRRPFRGRRPPARRKPRRRRIYEIHHGGPFTAEGGEPFPEFRSSEVFARARARFPARPWQRPFLEGTDAVSGARYMRDRPDRWRHGTSAPRPGGERELSPAVAGTPHGRLLAGHDRAGSTWTRRPPGFPDRRRRTRGAAKRFVTAGPRGACIKPARVARPLFGREDPDSGRFVCQAEGPAWPCG